MISVDVFIEEIVQVATLAKLTPSQQAVLLHDEGLADTFPNVNVALIIYLSMMFTSCPEERSGTDEELSNSMTHEKDLVLCAYWI